MTAPAPLALPGSRTLAGWWRQLAPRQPRAWWVGHILLHHVEALVGRSLLTRPDPLHMLVLKALALAPGEPLEQLEKRCPLSRQLLAPVLQALEQAAFLHADRRVTPLGQQAIREGAVPRLVHERRGFHFVAPDRAGDRPAFLKLEPPGSHPCVAPEGWSFAADALAACVARPAEWKERHGFPREIETILTLDTESTSNGPPSWRRVVVDRPERLPVIVVRTEDDRLLGFSYRPDVWVLHLEPPAFSLGADWADVFPALTDPPPLEEWLRAWQAWGQPRGLTGPGLEPTEIKQDGHRLKMTAPPRLLDKLRSTRSDALKGEAWLLAGSGRLRAAALVELAVPGPLLT